MGTLVSYSFPERQYKEIFNSIKPLLTEKELTFEPVEWPHISVAIIKDDHLTKEDKSWLQEKLHKKPSFKITDMEVLQGKYTPFAYLGLVMNVPSDYKDTFNEIDKKYEVLKYDELKPHCSILKVPKEFGAKLEEMLAEIKNKSKQYLYPVNPTHTLIWEAFKVSDVSEDTALWEDGDYKMSHESPDPENGKPMWDLRGIYPEDVYTSAARMYPSGESYDNEAASVIAGAKGRRDKQVKIYRAVPPDVAKINEGDWVAIVRQYAKDHGEGSLNGNYRILTKTVNARDLFSDGNSIQEWGYWPQATVPHSQRDPKWEKWPGKSSQGEVSESVSASSILAKWAKFPLNAIQDSCNNAEEEGREGVCESLSPLKKFLIDQKQIWPKEPSGLSEETKSSTLVSLEKTVTEASFASAKTLSIDNPKGFIERIDRFFRTKTEDSETRKLIIDFFNHPDLSKVKPISIFNNQFQLRIRVDNSEYRFIIDAVMYDNHLFVYDEYLYFFDYRVDKSYKKYKSRFEDSAEESKVLEIISRWTKTESIASAKFAQDFVTKHSGGDWELIQNGKNSVLVHKGSKQQIDLGKKATFPGVQKALIKVGAWKESNVSEIIARWKSFDEETNPIGIMVYRGENIGNKSKSGIGYWSTDLDFAINFTQTGLESEVKSTKINLEYIYDARKFEEHLPSANKESDFDNAMKKAKELGLYGMLMSEGSGQPNSIYVFDKRIFTEPIKLMKEDKEIDQSEEEIIPHLINPSYEDSKELMDFNSLRAALFDDDLYVWNPRRLHEVMVPYLREVYKLNVSKFLDSIPLMIDFRKTPVLVKVLGGQFGENNYKEVIDRLKKSKLKKLVKGSYDLLMSDYHGWSHQELIEVTAYHGTNRAFKEFSKSSDIRNAQNYGDGHYFTTSTDDASDYAGDEPGANVHIVDIDTDNFWNVGEYDQYVTIADKLGLTPSPKSEGSRNWFDFTVNQIVNEKNIKEIMKHRSASNYIAHHLPKFGFDGVVVPQVLTGSKKGDWYVVYNTNTIKHKFVKEWVDRLISKYDIMNEWISCEG